MSVNMSFLLGSLFKLDWKHLLRAASRDPRSETHTSSNQNLIHSQS